MQQPLLSSEELGYISEVFQAGELKTSSYAQKHYLYAQQPHLSASVCGCQVEMHQDQPTCQAQS